MSKNLNNNYSTNSTTNLQIATLTTNLAALSTSITTLATISYVDSSVNTSYLQSYSVGTGSISSAILSNNTLYILPLLSSYMSSVLTNSLINSLISTNNTVYIANLLSTALTSQNTIRDTAISTAISAAKVSFLAGVNTYTSNQVFSSLTTSSINYLGSFNSISLGTGCSPGVNSVTIGTNCLTNSSGVCIGSNSLIVNSGVNNSIVGANNFLFNTIGKSNVAIGQGCGTGNISGSNNVILDLKPIVLLNIITALP